MRCFQPRWTHAAAAIIVAGCLQNANGVQAQDKSTPQNAEKKSDATSDAAHADHHSPELGVLVGSSPGEGVCVIDTLQQGPADRAGIEPGDYILAINDQTVSNPHELKQRIDGLDSDDTIDVNLWRRGKYVNKEVRLAKKAAKLPESHRGWLGVVLAPPPEGQTGATIQEVASESPAEQAGLQRGDEIVKLNGKDVQSLEQFVNDVSDFEPGNEIKLTVRRDGDVNEINAELGKVVEAPVQWFRQQMGRSGMMQNMPMPGMREMPGMPVMDEMMNDMRRQIRVLRNEVDQLKQAAPQEKPAAKPAVKPAKKAAPVNDDVSSIAPRSDRSSANVVQHIPSQASLGDRVFLAQVPNISNDWSGARYTSPLYSGWRNSQQQQSTGTNYGGNYGGNYYPYNYGYGNYGYGNGYNPYRYYRYGGRPYYYGGGYPYGYRGGVGFGTGMGVYW